MDVVGIAERQEANGLAGQAQRDLPSFSFSTRGRRDREDQSDPAWLGDILCDRTLEPVFLVYPRPGRNEDTAPLSPGAPTSGFRLEAVEQGVAVRDAGVVFAVPRKVSGDGLNSRSGLKGPMWRALETGLRQLLN